MNPTRPEIHELFLCKIFVDVHTHLKKMEGKIMTSIFPIGSKKAIIKLEEFLKSHVRTYDPEDPDLGGERYLDTSTLSGEEWRVFLRSIRKGETLALKLISRKHLYKTRYEGKEWYLFFQPFLEENSSKT